MEMVLTRNCEIGLPQNTRLHPEITQIVVARINSLRRGVFLVGESPTHGAKKSVTPESTLCVLQI